MDVGLLMLRLVLGGVMAAHGAQKVFGWFDGPGPAGAQGMMRKLGYPPALPAFLPGGTELGAGILLMLGLLTPLGAAAVIGMMVSASVAVHLTNGFFNANGGIELPFVLGAVAAGLAFTGPGAISIDAAIGWDVSGWIPGIAALLVGVGVAVALLAMRRAPQPAPVEPDDHELAA
jgi:putative oxidoreductase